MTARRKREIGRARKGKLIRQVAALPYRRDKDGRIRFLLITSRNTRRVILPKGWTMKGHSLAEAAGIEAQEEAGAIGRIHKRPIGAYAYWKRLKSAFVPVVATVFPLEVEKLTDDWPERSRRGRAWLTREDAVRLVDEPQLASLIARFAP